MAISFFCVGAGRVVSCVGGSWCFADGIVLYIGFLNALQQGGAISVTEITAGTTVGYECSNRGICDRSTGECQCFAGYCSSNGASGSAVGQRGDCSYRDLMCKGRA